MFYSMEETKRMLGRFAKISTRRGVLDHRCLLRAAVQEYIMRGPAFQHRVFYMHEWSNSVRFIYSVQKKNVYCGAGNIG